MRQIQEFRQKDGVRRTLILEDGYPMYYPTLYGSMKLRNKSKEHQKNICYAIRTLYFWCESENIDLESRFKAGEHLHEDEIYLILDFCEWDAPTQKKIASGARMLPTAYSQVSKTSCAARISAIRDYIDWLFLRLSTSPDKKDIAWAVKSTINEYKPKIRNRHNVLDAVVVSEKQIKAITTKLLPNHPENPWKEPASRFRNLLIFSILYETGMRRGEMSGLYVNDVQDGQVSIRRRQNNPLETRENAPNVKGGERTIPIPEELARLIDHYVLHHRGPQKHPYLFVSHKRNKGQPLSYSGVNEVFKAARAGLPELEGLSPHHLRHHMNYRISQMIDANQELETATDKQIFDEDARPYLMGWSPDGTQQVRYNKRYNQETAGTMLVDRAERLNKGKDDEPKET